MAASLRVCDFYCGIGGMHHALKLADIECNVVAAFDVNDIANQTYHHNLGIKPITKSIDVLTAEYLSNLAGDLWVLSPPCQPYTRLGLKRDHEDPRAKSFLHLLEILPTMTHPPEYMLIENVKGFESSETRRILAEQLRACNNNYVFQEFHLTPLQFGLPNQRTRYFCLAKRAPKAFIHTAGENEIQERVPGSLHHKDPVSIRTLLDDHPLGDEFWRAYMVPDEVLARSRGVMDIVRPDDSRCCCFTKGYGRFVEGTGSVLEWKPEGTVLDEATPAPLRYFTPAEISRLHAFPPSFSFPAGISNRQCYQLLGNSLNVRVVAELATYLLKEPPTA